MSDIREKFWSKLTDNPVLMVGLDGNHDHSIPLSPQLDKNADSEFWFYTNKESRLADGGHAMAQFVSKSHDLYACIAGHLVEETDPAVIDRYWSPTVAAWYDGGREDPNLLMLRFELGDVEIWEAETSIKGLFKLLTGNKIDQKDLGKHVELTL